MPNQSSGNVLAAIKRETVAGELEAGGAGAYVLPTIDSPGLKLTRGTIESARKRRDMVRPLARLGSRDAGGTYNTEMLPGGAIDLLLESAVRSSFGPVLAPAAISVTTTTSTIVRAAGSFLTDGYRAGDIIILSGDTEAANNGIYLRVASVTALVITVGGTPLTTNAGARPVTITRLKKVMTPAVPVYHSYSIEQLDVDIDESEVFYGQRLTGLALSMRPNAMVTAAWTFMGLNRNILDTPAAPYFTNPTELSGLSLVADDMWLRYKGEDLGVITGLDLTFAIAAATQPVFGAGMAQSIDVFMNDLSISATLTAVRQTLDALRDFDAETQFEIQGLLTAPEAGVDSAIGFFLPAVKIMDIDAPFQGGEGAKVETRQLSIGPTAGDADNDATAAIFYSSAA